VTQAALTAAACTLASVANRPSPADPYAPLPPHLDPRGRHRGHRAAKARGQGVASLQILGRTLGVILSVGLLLLAGYYWYTFRTINKGVHRLHVGVNAPPSGKHDIDGTDQNILLVGNDDRSNMTDVEVKKLHVGRGSGSKATDTMMIVHVPADGSRATLISLPRDSYVKIPGYSMNKLNAAYVLGYNDATGDEDQKRGAGADLLIKTVTNLTGLTINHYIQVSLMGFYEISNAIGGVPVNMCKSVIDTVRHNREIGLSGGSGLVLSKGKHSIKGVQALEFVRQRENLPHGDIDRVRRQQYFLTAAFRKVATVGILFKLNALGDAVKRNIYLDPTLNLIDLAHQMEKLSANNIIGKTIPFERFQDESVGNVEIVDPAKVQRFVAALINPPAPAKTTPAPGSVTSSKTSTASPSPSASKAIDAKCIN
jgi:LCP family protein required for cell wall assembly